MNLHYSRTIIIHDLLVAAFAWELAWLVRFGFNLGAYPNWQLGLYTLPLVVIIQGLVYLKFGLNQGLWHFVSLPDLQNIIRAVLVGVIAITTALFIWNRLAHIPRLVLVLYPIFLSIFLCGSRLIYRVWKEHSLHPKSGWRTRQQVLIVGANKVGAMFARTLLGDNDYLPVGFADNNQNIKNMELHGIPGLGTIDEIAMIAKQYPIDLVVVAIPQPTRKQIQQIMNHCNQAEVPVRMLSNFKEVFAEQEILHDLRDISVADLLGREEIQLDWVGIRQDIKNKIILVSGGGGSIGSELCCQVAALNPAALIIFEHSELNLWKIHHKISALHPQLILHAVLGNIRDEGKVAYIMNKYHPDVIFHAAAYKQLPLLENQAQEAVSNNIIGTKNLAESAAQCHCEKFIFISTDKAVNPTSILGASKRMSELYCQWMNQHATTRFITVRFGNVLDSAGSVVPLFRKQIKNGGPVTVTHPEVTRYFMTVSEACQLILQVSALGEKGGIYALDMGKQIKIAYLAEQMIRMSGEIPNRDIKIVYTGLRPGEKLCEELFYVDEYLEATSHKKIFSTQYLPVDWQRYTSQFAALEQAAGAFDEEGIALLLGQNMETARTVNNVVLMRGEK